MIPQCGTITTVGTDKIEKTSILFAVSGILLVVCKQPPEKEGFGSSIIIEVL